VQENNLHKTQEDQTQEKESQANNSIVLQGG
jgi:hypothetical protein